LSEKIILNGNEFILIPQKAMFWSKECALVLSDIHLGKATHFRKNGIPIPAEAGKFDLLQLESLIELYQPKKVFVVGDLFHSHLNVEWDWFKDFINRHASTSFVLLRGNHDILPAFQLKLPNLETLHKYVNHGICLIHEPRGDETEYAICGHIHPGFTLRGKAKQVLRLPCFVIGSTRTILPAFGGLTGLANFEKLSSDRIWVIADNQLIEITAF
jgi:putative SbcD/Mre11-related phosphoesterase